MKPGEKGFTFVELVIALGITLLVSGASTMALSQIYGGTDRNNNHLTAVRQVENAGFWISRDAQRAQSISTDNLTPPDFLLLTWTEWDDDDYDDPIYHSVRYSFDNITANIGRLKRNYWSSAGANEQTLVGLNLYYNPGDSENTSKASYQSTVLTVRLTAILDKARETREYRIMRRPNVN